MALILFFLLWLLLPLSTGFWKDHHFCNRVKWLPLNQEKMAKTDACRFTKPVSEASWICAVAVQDARSCWGPWERTGAGEQLKDARLEVVRGTGRPVIWALWVSLSVRNYKETLCSQSDRQVWESQLGSSLQTSEWSFPLVQESFWQNLELHKQKRVQPGLCFWKHPASLAFKHPSRSLAAQCSLGTFGILLLHFPFAK